MVEDTIRTIRDTEKQAHEIVEDARRESEHIMKDAQERAKELREEIINLRLRAREWREQRKRAARKPHMRLRQQSSGLLPERKKKKRWRW